MNNILYFPYILHSVKLLKSLDCADGVLNSILVLVNFVLHLDHLEVRVECEFSD